MKPPTTPQPLHSEPDPKLKDVQRELIPRYPANASSGVNDEQDAINILMALHRG